MNPPLHIALFGCGTVGAGVARLLLDHPDRLAARAGRQLVLRKVVVRDVKKQRAVTLSQGLLTGDPRPILADPTIHVGVELIGGVDVARQTCLRILAAGKHLVTANKALLARHGSEIFEAARKHDRTVVFEGSVAGGIPIIAAIAQGLAANQIIALQGILNGTCNFILTGMSEQDLSYTMALREAQRLGYAEADPTLDVTGADAAHKLAILARLAFGANVPVDAIHCRGITDLDDMDIRFARELGYTIKLLAEAWLDHSPHEPQSPSQLALHVSPVLLRHQAPLAQVRGAYNAIQVMADAVGDTLYYGRGAGQMPTASAVVADLIDLAIGRAQRTFQTLGLWLSDSRVVLRPSTTVRTRFYLRLMVPDQPGILAEVARILADHHISIASLIQHEALENEESATVPLVIMTHSALTDTFRAALADIESQVHLAHAGVYFPVGD